MYVLYSISFSVPRCSSPICGSARSTTSPSISRISRNTPCAAGCCGPKLIAWLSISTTLVADGRASMSGISLIVLRLLRRRRLRFHRPRGMHLLVARQGGDRLPRREEIERPEILRQPHRLVNHRFAILVVADFHIAGQREILA